MRRGYSWLGVLALGLVACGGDSSPTEQSPGNTTGDVVVSNNVFTPGTLNVSAGGTVTWTWNSGGTVHNVTFDDGEYSIDQGSGSYNRTFSTAGSYPYRCTIHGPSMSGVVTVGTTGGSGGGGGNGGGGGYGGGGSGG